MGMMTNNKKDNEHQRMNKRFPSQLIKILAAALKNQHIEIKQCKSDADVVIIKTSLEKSQKSNPTIVIQDVDVLMCSR